MPTSAEVNPGPDVVLVGAGVMSATLGVLLRELDPSLRVACILVTLVESLAPFSGRTPRP